MRTPLNVLAGYMSLLDAEPRTLGAPKLSEYVACAAEAADQLNRVAESASRYEYLDGEPSEWKNFSVLSILRGAVDAMRAEEQSAIDLRYDASQLGETIIRCERRVLVDVVAELLSNAALHAGRPPIVEISAFAAPDGGAGILVEDDGRGLKTEDFADALAPFIKPRAVENVAAPGIGLGLPRVVAAMANDGGALYLSESTIGGLGVALRFPSEHVVTPPTTPTTPIDLAQRGYRVLGEAI